jgi:hypothetical protein
MSIWDRTCKAEFCNSPTMLNSKYCIEHHGEVMAKWDFEKLTREAHDEYYGVDRQGNEIKSDGGPAQYYDFPPNTITLNDLIEHKEMDFHRGNIFKACWRYGTKSGTTKEYDARKIIYSGARILMQLVGVAELRNTLQKMLDDSQFQERK